MHCKMILGLRMCVHSKIIPYVKDGTTKYIGYIGTHLHETWINTLSCSHPVMELSYHCVLEFKLKKGFYYKLKCSTKLLCSSTVSVWFGSDARCKSVNSIQQFSKETLPSDSISTISCIHKFMVVFWIRTTTRELLRCRHLRSISTEKKIPFLRHGSVVNIKFCLAPHQIRNLGNVGDQFY